MGNQFWPFVYYTPQWIDSPRHGIVDGGHQSQNICSRITNHITCQGSSSPELLVPSVDVLDLLLHGVDGGVVELAQGVEADVLDLVNRFASVLELEDSVGCLGVEDALDEDVELEVERCRIIATIMNNLKIKSFLKPFHQSNFHLSLQIHLWAL